MEEPRKEEGFYKPAMAPLFLDSRRSTRLGLGLNLGGCCRVADVRVPLHGIKIVPDHRPEKRQDHANPLFAGHGGEDSFRFPIQPSPPSPQSPRSPRSPLVVPEFPAADDDDLDFRGYFSPDGSCSSSPCASVGRLDEGDRAVEIKWKGMDLPVYDGQWDSDVIEEWVSKMDSFFQICCPSMSEQEKIHCAAFHLSGAAHKWWRIVSSRPKNKDRRPRSPKISPEVDVSALYPLKSPPKFFVPEGNFSKIDGNPRRSSNIGADSRNSFGDRLKSPPKFFDPEGFSKNLSKIDGNPRRSSNAGAESRNSFGDRLGDSWTAADPFKTDRDFELVSKIDADYNAGSKIATAAQLDADRSPARKIIDDMAKKSPKIDWRSKKSCRTVPRAAEGSIQSWEELKGELMRFFGPGDVAAMGKGSRGDRSLLLRRLEGMKQEYGMPLREYGQQYLEVYLDAIARGLPTWDVVLAYVEGLASTKLSHVLSHTVSSPRASLQSTMRLASFFERDPAAACPVCSMPYPFSSCS